MSAVEQQRDQPAPDWIRAWHTHDAPAAEQFQAWCDLLHSAFGPLMNSTREGDGPFPAFIGQRAAGPLGLFHIQAPAQHVDYPGATGAHATRDMVFLNLLVRGSGTVEQDGRVTEQRPGQFFVLDSSRPFHKHFTSDFEQLCFTLPLELLAPRLADPSAATALRVPGDHGVGALVATMLRTLAVDMASLDRRTAATVSASLADLLALALGRADTPCGTAQRTLLRQAALDAVERDLTHPHLCPDHVARQINVSVRYLHQLFADHGVTFSRWVLGQRLERCRRDLENPAWDHVGIGAIATRWGFADPSHFGRAFRARYGRSPSEYRRGQGR